MIISPLRYDILVRKEYFLFFESNINLFYRNFQQYVTKAQEHSYFTWFIEVVCKQQFSHLLYNRNKLSKAFEVRLKKSAHIYQRFQKVGFDTRYPISLSTGESILPTLSGKFVNVDCYAGDGCHRIAMLMLTGHKFLLPEHYRLKCFREFRARDNTNLLIRPLSISQEEYFSFLSTAYTGKYTFTDKESIIHYIRNKEPSRLAEIETVIKIDEFQIRGGV
jgi:hypothetical protein